MSLNLLTQQILSQELLCANNCGFISRIAESLSPAGHARALQEASGLKILQLAFNEPCLYLAQDGAVN